MPGMSVAAIIPAAGESRRFGGRVRKPWVKIDGRPLLAYTLQALQASPSVRWIALAVREDAQARVREVVRCGRITKALPMCIGGASRAESVARAFARLPQATAWVLVHDAARPCVSPSLIERAVRAAKRYGAVVCGQPATLTVKAADAAGRVRLTLDRDRLWFAQTPQVFRREWFAEALAKADGQLALFPDDVSILEAAGFDVRMIPGDPMNMKVTTKDDLLLAGAILRRRAERSGA